MPAQGPASADPAVPFSNDVANYVYGTGSDASYGLMVALGDAYNESQGCNQTGPHGAQCAPAPQSGVIKTENYDHDVVVSRFPVSSNVVGIGNATVPLCRQTAPRPAGVPVLDYAFLSTGPGSLEGCVSPAAGVTLRSVAFARAAVTPVNWRGQPGSPAAAVGNLTQPQLNDSFVDCVITNWSQVGGANAPIEVWTIQPTYATRVLWDWAVGGNSANCVPDPAHLIAPDTVVPIEAAGGFADAIAPFSVPVHRTDATRAGASQLTNVNGVPPTSPNIVSGQFPFTTDVYNVYRLDAGPLDQQPVASAAALGFMGENGWICKPPGLHSEPPGTPGPGMETPLATRDYGQLVIDLIRAAGFEPKFDDFGSHCTFADITIPGA